MGNRYFSVMLVPGDDGPIRNFRVPQRIFPILLGGAALALLLLLGSIYVVFQAHQTHQTARRVEQENQILRGHVETMEGRMAAVSGLVQESELLEREARLLAGLDPLDDETRQLGIGGPLTSVYDEAPVSDLDLRIRISDQAHRLDALSRRVAFQRDSYVETLQVLGERKDRLDHTPTISPLGSLHSRTSGYGWREDPFTGARSFHHGVDLRAPAGTPVLATAAGEVISVKTQGDFGLTVKIDHGEGLVTQYSHLQSAMAKEGQAVRRGDVIAALGSSGRSTGPHVHYEVQVNGVAQNPKKYILTSGVVVD